MEAREWLLRHRRKLDRESKYETMFVERVLSRVRGLDFSNVGSQTPFFDSQGRRRRVDFTITEGEHVRLAIEVDGYDKTGRGSGMSREEWEDWLRRETDLVAQGWRVLRFANSEVTRNPAACAEKVTLTLEGERATAAQVLGGRTDLPSRRSSRPHPFVLQARRKYIRWGVLALGVVLIAAAGVAALTSARSRSQTQPTGPRAAPNAVIDWTEAARHVGSTLTVRGRVANTHYASDVSGRPTFINIGNAHPSPDRVTVVVWGDDRSRFPFPPEQFFGRVCATGKIALFQGVPEIEITSPSNLRAC